MTAMLALVGLGKDYGDRHAVDSVDLAVPAGTIFGLLGPNGAGKTTTISMASGVITPTRGTAHVDGHDVWKAPRKAKRALGLVPQELAIYDELSARQNLWYFGRLYGLAGAELGQRIEWALGVAGLTDRAKDRVDQFSGGMKRRLNLAAGILHKPKLLILDEPTVGVDPQSRNHIFETVKALRDDGATILYTSHYMEEVEALCDRIAIMDHGVLIAAGTIDELTARHGGDGLDIEVDGDATAARAAAAAAATAAGADAAAVGGDGDVIRVPAIKPVAPLFAAIEATGATVRSVASRRGNLEGVFLALTGKALRDQ
jgi:linearmycin/streptolysin S transport system ATP-binding protein